MFLGGSRGRTPPSPDLPTPQMQPVPKRLDFISDGTAHA